MTSDARAASPTGEHDRRGRKRALIALGSLLAAGALATSAYFTDTALLDLNGSGGFGSPDNRYNLQVSTGMEDTVAKVAKWVEANPDSAAIANIPGASALIPGNSIVVKIPVKNDSKNWASTLKLSLKNTTATDGVTADQQARNTAYLSLITVDVAETDDASTVPKTWTKTGLTLPTTTSGSSSESVALTHLPAGSGTVLYLKLTLNDKSQQQTDAANGGAAGIQAVIDGTSVAKN